MKKKKYFEIVYHWPKSALAAMCNPVQEKYYSKDWQIDITFVVVSLFYEFDTCVYLILSLEQKRYNIYFLLEYDRYIGDLLIFITSHFG